MSDTLTRFGFLKQLGFPQTPTPSDILGVIRQRYGADLPGIDLIIWYGSRQPTSDVDVMIVTNAPTQNYWNGWLDIYALQREEFDHCLALLDLSVTDPMLSGHLLYGDNNNFVQRRCALTIAPITPTAIAHNNAQAKAHQAAISRLRPGSRAHQIATSYAATYERHTQYLQGGSKRPSRK